MYRLAFKDYREHVDYVYETEWAAWSAYLSVLGCCIGHGIAADISLIDENTTDILAHATYSGDVDDDYQDML